MLAFRISKAGKAIRGCTALVSLLVVGAASHRPVRCMDETDRPQFCHALEKI